MAKSDTDDEKSVLGKMTPVSIRLEARLRYMAELAARHQRRSLTSFIESAIQSQLRDSHFEDACKHKYDNFWDAMPILWDDSEAERIAKLALKHPDLLEHNERLIWKTVLETDALWRGTYDKNGEYKKAPQTEENFRFPKLREHWETIEKVASGRLPATALPKLERKNSKQER